MSDPQGADHDDADDYGQDDDVGGDEEQWVEGDLDGELLQPVMSHKPGGGIADDHCEDRNFQDVRHKHRHDPSN